MSHIGIIMQAPLKHFAGIVHANRDRIFRLWLITPWLAAENGKYDPITLLVEALRGKRCSVNLVTRKPKEVWHNEAVRTLSSCLSVTLFYCQNLHTKLYILECDNFRYAMLGSPNLTAHSDRHSRELAVEFRTTVQSSENEVAALISQLLKYASCLTSEDEVELIQ